MKWPPILVTVLAMAIVGTLGWVGWYWVGPHQALPGIYFNEDKMAHCIEIWKTDPYEVRSGLTGKVVERRYLSWEDIRITDWETKKDLLIGLSGNVSIGQKVCEMPPTYEIYSPTYRTRLFAYH